MAEIKKIRVCVAGATGWAASALCRGIVATADIEVVVAVARRSAGQRLNDVLQLPPTPPIPIFATLEEALQIPCDVVVEYTSADSAKHHVITALQQGRAVVVGSSGLSGHDYAEIEAVATQTQQPVLAVGNFAISVVLLTKFAELAARYMPHWEIIDYASAAKPDAPSGSALELAHRLAGIGQPTISVPIAATHGQPSQQRAAPPWKACKYTRSGCRALLFP
jgi:4-hydroxy-tetrahydrodipicolinate reductase